MSRLENRGEEAWAIFRAQYSFSHLFLCSFVKNIFLLRFDQLDFLLLLFLCMSSSTGQPLSFPLPPLKMNGELSFLLRNWSVRIFLILISSLIIGCSSSIKRDQAFLLSHLTSPPPITTNRCRKIINTFREKPEYVGIEFEKNLFNQKQRVLTQHGNVYAFALYLPK